MTDSHPGPAAAPAEERSAPRSDAADPALRAGLALVIALGVLGLALLVGVGIGRNRAEEELLDDPIGALEAERLETLGQVHTLTPPLHGRGPAPDPQAVQAAQERLEALLSRAGRLSVPLDTLASQAGLARARFELALRRGQPGDLERAREQLGRVGQRGEEPVLRARLQLAQGEQPDLAWLQAWVDTDDAAVAEAARLLCAELVAAEDPERARRLLSERVDPRLAKAVLARIEVAAAARRLEPESLQLALSSAGEEAAQDPRLRQQIAQRGLARSSTPGSSALELTRILRVIALLRGEVGPVGPRLARSALGHCQRGLEAVGRDEEGRARRTRELRELWSALEETGFQAGPCLEGGRFLDALCAGSYEPELVRLGLRLSVRLDLRLLPPHLSAVAAQREPLLAASGPFERAVGLRLRGDVSLADVRPLLGALGPAQRAQLLLAAQANLPSGPERLALCEEARQLDPGHPDALLARWRADSEPPPAEASAQLSAAARDLVRERPGLEEQARAWFAALSALQRERGQVGAALATEAELGRYFPREPRPRSGGD